ncbi:MAG: hypothetical protein HFI09_00190 [Bacilli bacterium]|nr:hypothetical protein [Bacilli bacterium]
MKEKKGETNNPLNQMKSELHYDSRNNRYMIYTTTYEKEQYRKKSQKSFFLTLLSKTAFIGLCCYMFIPNKNNFSNWDETRIKIQNALDSDGNLGLVQYEIMSYIENNKQIDKESFETIYNYFFIKYKKEIDSSDIRNIIDLISKDYYTILTQNTLLNDCFSSIINAQEHKYSGSIRLSIICDILGKEETIYLLLTNQEQTVYDRLKQKLNVTEEEFQDFLVDLNKLNEISNGIPVGNYNFYAITKTIISKYSKVSIEKTLLMKMLEEQTMQEFIPVGSFFTRTMSDYPLRINNRYMKESEILVNQSLSQIEDLPNIATTIFQNKRFYMDEDLSTIISFLPNCSEKLVYGLQNNDTRSIQFFLDKYIENLFSKDISLNEVCEINTILEYLKKIHLNAKVPVTFKDNFENSTKSVFVFKGKENYSFLINKESIEFEKILGHIQKQLPTTIYYPCYEAKEDSESKDISWIIQIPKEDSDIIPIVLIQDEFGQVKTVLWEDLVNEAKIIEDENNVTYYINGIENGRIAVAISIDEYLKVKDKSISRRKEKNYDD